MKVKTNLTSDELMRVSKGLSKLATRQQEDGRFVASNPAESELLAEASDALDEMLDCLKTEISDLFKGE